MPSNRRLKSLIAIAAIIIFLTVYLTGNGSRGDFYNRTAKALKAKEQAANDLSLKEAADQELEAIIQHAQDLAGGDNVHEVYQSNPESSVPVEKEKAKAGDTEAEMEEISIGGRKKMSRPKPINQKTDIAEDEEVAFNGGKELDSTDPGIEIAKDELNLILKKSPIIIFSKTSCPHCRQAKQILIDAYKITPAPYVVELDTLNQKVSGRATLGTKLQELLTITTGRKTVPNILINGRSIGGADDIVKLDHQGELVEKIREMGGRWVHGMDIRFSTTDD